MKCLFFYMIICCLLSLSLVAQNNSLSGKVFFLSSGKTPAVGVAISGSIKMPDGKIIKANPGYSATNGSYTLIFPKAGAGHLVELEIGDTDAGGQALELVNEEEVNLFMIPENPEDQFEIIICKKGERDAVAERYYNIIKSSADEELAKKKAAWAVLVDQEEKDHEKIAELGDMIARLEKQADSIPLYKEAFRMASINKDNATKRVRRYLNLLDKGKSIQEARKALSIKKAVNELDKSASTFNAGIEELQTRASASKSIFDYKDAIQCYDTIIYYSEEMKIKRLKMAGYYIERAHLNLSNGDYKTALGYLQRTSGIRERNLPSNHPDLMTTYNDIGTTYQFLSQYKTALGYYKNAIDIWEKILDADYYHSSALAHYNVANVYRVLGKYKTALEYNKKAIALLKAISSTKDRDLNLAYFYDNRANIYSALDQHETSLHYHQKSIEIMEKTPDKHPDLAMAYNNISGTYKALGQYKTALEYNKKAMAILEKILHLKHPRLAISYTAIGNTYQKLGRYVEALDYHQKSLNIREVVLDPKHIDLADSYGNIGQAYQKLGRYTEALTYYKKSLDIQEVVLDPKHINMAFSYIEIGEIYQKLEKYETALEYHQKAMHIQKETLDPKHSYLAITYGHIGTTYRGLGQDEKALNYFQKAMAIQEEVLDPKHPDLAMAYNNIGTMYCILDQYENALEYQQKAILINEEALGFKHPYLAINYNTISATYRALREYKTALEYHQKAIGIQEEVLGSEHFDLVSSYDNIARTYHALSRYEKALEYQQKAMRIQEGVLGLKHPGLSFRYWNIAEAYKGMKNFQKAIASMEKCVAIFKEALPENNPYQKKALITLAGIYIAKGLNTYNNKHYIQAIEEYQKAVVIYPEIKVQEKYFYYNNIGLAYAKNRQFKEAYNAFTKYEKLFPDKGRAYRNWAMYYALQNDKEKALANLQKAVKLGYKDIKWLKTDDSIDGLRSEKVFMELVRKLEKQKRN